MRFTICYRQIYRDTPFAIHAADCRDVAKTEIPHNDAHVQTDEFPSIDAAVSFVLDEDLRDMGYDASHVKVYPCCKR